jgi:hypothetical protein
VDVVLILALEAHALEVVIAAAGADEGEDALFAALGRARPWRP